MAFTSADIDGSDTLESMSLSANRQRLMFEGEHVQKLDSGATFTPSVEIGLRNDGGDGDLTDPAPAPEDHFDQSVSW